MNLTKCNFIRLRNNPLFWTAIVISIFNPLYTVLNNYYYGKQFGHRYTPDDALVMIADGYIFPIALSIWLSLFIGIEYSDKTIRNKIIAGHSRIKVYLSNLFTSIVSALAMYATGIIVAISVGIPLLGSFTLPIKMLLPQILCAVISVSALASIYVLLAMLISSRVISSLTSLLLSAGLAYLPLPLWDKLNSAFCETAVTGWTHTLYQVIYDFLPTCQLYQYTSDIEDFPKRLAIFPVCSMLIIAATTAIGIISFNKKNLK